MNSIKLSFKKYYFMFRGLSFYVVTLEINIGVTKALHWNDNGYLSFKPLLVQQTDLKQ
jgi:hypothetical protein